MRHAVAAILAFILWSVLWLGFNALLRQAGLLPESPTQPVNATGTLFALLAGSAVISLIAGYVAKLIDPTRSNGAVIALGVLLVATGVFFEVQSWALLPLWYHLLFLALLLPACFVGARLKSHAAAR